MSARKKSHIKRKIKLLKKVIDIGIFLLVVLMITFVVNTYVVERCKVHNHSMEPTLKEGNILLIDKISYKNREPKRYEIITFKNDNNKDDLIKRIIGLPGETVRIVQGRIFIDGNEIKDINGLEMPVYAGSAENDFKLDDEEYFVLGDNRKESIDSRYDSIGAIKRDDIIGRALIRIRPLSNPIIH